MLNKWWQIRSETTEETKTSYKSYRIYEHPITICSCKGRLPAKDKPDCEHNRNRETRAGGWCFYYKPNGTNHCSWVKQVENSKEDPTDV